VVAVSFLSAADITTSIIIVLITTSNEITKKLLCVS